MTAPVVVIAETRYGELTLASLECVEEARDLADSLGTSVHALLPGYGIAAMADDLVAHGADRVTVVEHLALSQFTADGWLAALTPILQAEGPVLTLAPDSDEHRAWLPRLSARWRIPMATGCIRVKITDQGYPEVFRVSHSGKLHERQIWARGTAVMAMLCPGVRGIGPRNDGRRAEIGVVEPTLNAFSFRDRTLRTFPPDPHDVDLTEAERIVSGGLGVGGPEGMARLQELADALNASLGGTRVVADRGWLPPDRFIGTTGKIVTPKLYVALGVSGAGQHLAGIGGSETVVAINTDRTAPMLKMADLGVVGDLHQILPILVRKLRERGKSVAESRAAPPDPGAVPVIPIPIDRPIREIPAVAAVSESVP